ncbi:C-type lectin [Plakobranchus ocellatus]|uniref:C-type lectin n=1 Tax=Plakobranchus ocellatus TaxID=259542 RepID=A0AAV3Y4W9_9GAST|nr:C-type lectin [Plakobranchus ocellatus]
MLVACVDLCTAANISGIFDPCYFWPDSRYAGEGICLKLNESLLTFREAQAACVSDGGGFLAEIRTARQRSMAGFTAHTAAEQGEAWLGATNPSGHTSLAWVSDHVTLDVPLTWWVNETVQEGKHGQVCLTIDRDFLLSISACDIARNFVCQRYTEDPCEAFLPGGIYYEDICFLPVAKTLTFDQAVLYCNNLGSPSLLSSDEFTLFTHWQTISGWYLDGSLIWFPSDAFAGTDKSNMAYVLNTFAVTKTYAEVPKTSSAYAVCFKSLTTEECDGVFFDRRCFKLHTDIVSWEQAKAACDGPRSYLAEPKTELRNEVLIRYIEDTNGTAARFHIGATDLAREGVFIWYHSGQPMSETFTAWGTGQPDNAYNEDYACLHRFDIRNWNDIQQIHTGKYVCERVYPEYFHSYVMVLPSETWHHDIHSMSALLTASSRGYHLGHNYIEVTTVPGGVLEELSVIDVETAQYQVNIANLTLGTHGIQQKYLLVKSSEPLDVHFFMWSSDLRVFCSSLVLDVLESGGPNSYLGHSGLHETSFAFVSTEASTSTLDVYLPSTDGSLDFHYSKFHTESRTTMTMSTTLSEQYQTFYAGSVSGLTNPMLVQSTGALSVFTYSREDSAQSTDASMDQLLPMKVFGRRFVTFPSLPMNAYVVDHFTVVAFHADTVITVYAADPAQGSESMTLSAPGDTRDLLLPATAFHSLTGNFPFYLYAKYSTSGGGLCTVNILPSKLYKQSYRFSMTEPLAAMDSVYVATIVQTTEIANISLTPGGGVGPLAPEMCAKVQGTSKSGCYFKLNKAAGTLYTLGTQEESLPQQFAAYVFAKSTRSLACYALGADHILGYEVNPDVDGYLASLESDLLCEEPTQVTTSSADSSGGALLEAAPVNGLSVSVYGRKKREVVQESSGVSWVNEPAPNGAETSPVQSTAASPGCKESNVQDVNITLTSEELEEVIEKIVSNLWVEKSSLSSSRRKKESTPDERVSSTTMGVVSISFIATILGLIIVSDFPKLFLDLKKALIRG